MMATNSVAWRALILTALVFSANFSVWTIYASIGMNLMAELQLSAFYLGLLLAAPIFSGALLRLLLGLLLPVVMARGCSAKLIVCVLMMLLLPGLALLPQAVSYGDYVLFGFWLGLGGASLVACIAYLTPWFNFRQQGFALGILGAGSIGAAVSLFFFPFLI